MIDTPASVAPDPRPLLGLAAGLVAGVVASAAMSFFQAQTAAAFDVEGDAADSSTAKAADAVVVAATGEHLSRNRKPAAGEVVHYVLGAALGAAYGVAAEYRPSVASGFGTAYGIVTSAVLDEAVVPALGLSDGPAETPANVHLYGVASHLVFGLVLEGVRTAFGGRRD